MATDWSPDGSIDDSGADASYIVIEKRRRRRVIEWTTPGSFTISLTTPTLPVPLAELIVVAGGGAGAGTTGSRYGGGGGAGAIYHPDEFEVTGDISVTVGTGTSYVSGANQGASGGDTIFGTWTLYGGGGGGRSVNLGAGYNGVDGGSGGGGGGGTSYSTGGTATHGLDNGVLDTVNILGTDGDAGYATNTGSGGGASVQSAITGTVLTYAVRGPGTNFGAPTLTPGSGGKGVGSSINTPGTGGQPGAVLLTYWIEPALKTLRQRQSPKRTPSRVRGTDLRALQSPFIN